MLYRDIVIISDWLLEFGFCLHHLTYYMDFQLLTVIFRSNIKEDWIILQEDLEATNEEENFNSETDLEEMGPSVGEQFWAPPYIIYIPKNTITPT